MKPPQKKEVKPSSFGSISFGIDRIMSRMHRTSGKNPASRPPPADPRARKGSFARARSKSAVQLTKEAKL